ncbi:MAG: hypothetical protein JWM20_499 [Patescibacteria group bacterium]|nr:hypothetical protein [Patescibacteria group bacterium]
MNNNNILALPCSESGSAFVNWLQLFNIPIHALFSLSRYEEPEFRGTIEGKDVSLMGFDEINAWVLNYEKEHFPIAA